VVNVLSSSDTFQAMNAFKGSVQRWAMQAEHAHGRDGHTPVVKLSPETRVRGKKLLDEAVGVPPADRQQLLLSLIGGEGLPGT